MPILLRLQELQGKGDGGWGKKVSLHRFLADQKIANAWRKFAYWHPLALAASSCLLPDTF